MSGHSETLFRLLPQKYFLMVLLCLPYLSSFKGLWGFFLYSYLSTHPRGASFHPLSSLLTGWSHLGEEGRGALTTNNLLTTHPCRAPQSLDSYIQISVNAPGFLEFSPLKTEYISSCSTPCSPPPFLVPFVFHADTIPTPTSWFLANPPWHTKSLPTLVAGTAPDLPRTFLLLLLSNCLWDPNHWAVLASGPATLENFGLPFCFLDFSITFSTLVLLLWLHHFIKFWKQTPLTLQGSRLPLTCEGWVRTPHCLTSRFPPPPHINLNHHWACPARSFTFLHTLH